MPRGARIVLANHPHHIVHRGHNRLPVFTGDDSYRHYLDALREWKLNLGCKVYAFCLMTNHIHLLVDPGNDRRCLALLMKRVASRQTRLLNRIEVRTGTLWESRFKSSPIDTERYLMACCRYIEWNPVRAGMVCAPDKYPWSSCGIHLGVKSCDWLDTMPGVRASSPPAPDPRYRELLLSPVSAEEAEFLRSTVNRGQLTGDARFIDAVERFTGRRIEHRGPGRPLQVQPSGESMDIGM